MSVTAAKGFRAAGVASGIKPGGDPDLAIVAASRAVPTAAVFTVNRAAAAPVVLSRRHLAASPSSAAVVVNSGCANAGTGATGAADALEMATTCADMLACRVEDVLVASTGPIGPPMPMAAVRSGIRTAYDELGATPDAAAAASRAILTTDGTTKEVVVDGGGFVVGGMAKGAGMVRPDMATMLAFLTTDADIGASRLDAALRAAVDASFHSLTIDGCSSTNDMVAVMASGVSGVAPEEGEFEAVLAEACRSLAGQMAADAEGASRVVALQVAGAVSEAAARGIGRAIADSALVRASFFGGDPNWGRLLGALGASGLDFEPDEFAVSYQGVPVAARGVAVDYDRGELSRLMAKGDLDVDVVVGAGPGRAVVLTNDLTPEYVRFNGEPS